MDVSWGVVVLLGGVLVVGALTQSVAGFGIAVVGAPFVAIIAPDLMPGAMLVASIPLPLIEVAGGWREIDVPVLGWALTGRLLTTPLGVLLVAWLSATSISVLVGVMVLIAVAASLWAIEVKAGPRPALIAGLLTGISGTAASIGGPFMGVVMQRESPARLRSTLALFFVVGATSALAALGIGGQLHREQVLTGLVWAPFVLLGLALSVPVRRRVRADQMRPIVLALAAVAGVTVIVRALVVG